MQRISEPRLYRAMRLPHASRAPLALPREFQQSHTRTPRAPRASRRTIDPLVFALWIAVLIILAILWRWIGGEVAGVLFASPYFVHPPDFDPTADEGACRGCDETCEAGCSDSVWNRAERNGTVTIHYSRQEANDAAGTGRTKKTIRLILSRAERDQWQARESRRFRSADYLDLPWTKHGIPDAARFDQIGVSQWTPEEKEIWQSLQTHYVHYSTEHPEHVAYTPSAEHGFQDRQVRIKIGRYVEQFLIKFTSKALRTRWIDEVRAYGEGFRLCANADEVEEAYTGERHGSCMGHDSGEYDSPIHPVRLYADSPDLAVAYMGSLSAVRARCIVWPEKKLYSRVYGDLVLEKILERAGYKCNRSSLLTNPSGHKNNGSLAGARMPVVMDGSKAIMPYLDCAQSADRSPCGKYWILRVDDDGEIGVKDASYLSGYADMREDDRRTCAVDDCESRVRRSSEYCAHHTERYEGECYACNDSQFRGEDDFTYVDGYLYCQACADSRCARTCSHCDTTWYARARATVDQLCPDCEEIHTTCDIHQERYCTEDDGECASCVSEREARQDAIDRAVPIFGEVLLRDQYDGSLTYAPTVVIVYQASAFAVHRVRGTSARDRYTVTHTPSGFAMASGDLEMMTRLAHALSLTDGIVLRGQHLHDWSTPELGNYPNTTRRFVDDIMDRLYAPPPVIDLSVATDGAIASFASGEVQHAY